MTESKQIMDGCTAAAYAAYALSDLATIYPITPIASMGETADKWALQGRTNIWGRPMEVKEMESELGAAGATHGAAAAGALATTFTASQGLLLMIPNMFKISGELLPVVFHVGTRSLATHALSIFGDHQDIMATRSTGFAFLGSTSVQEALDLGVVAHLAAIDGSLPVVHFFDGWRTSNEMDTISVIPYDTIASLVDNDKVRAIRDRGMNPCHPDLRGSAQNPDVYFQNREAPNRYYDAFPDVVQAAMDRLAKATGRQYHLFDYYGDPEAEAVVVIMGSGSHVIRDTADYLNARGYKVGVVTVRLFRPFRPDLLMQAVPATVKRIAVLDRTKEPGSNGEPLFQDVATAVLQSGRRIDVIGGRYGLSSKEFNPAMAKAVFDNALSNKPKRQFTVGINDDVTHLSLTVGPDVRTIPDDMVQCLFYGIGSDGTVGACKQAASLIGNAENLYAQAYFHYSAKKSGGYTKSELRFGHRPVRAEYAIESADYVACNKNTYVKEYALLDQIKDGGIFVLNSPWTLEQMETEFPASLKRAIARKRVWFYNIDAFAIAARTGLGVRINSIMQTVFFKLIGVIPFDEAIERFKKIISTTYMHEGNAVVNQNYAAIEAAVDALKQVDYPASWADAVDAAPADDIGLPEFIRKIAIPCNRLEGDSIPVSALDPAGIMPMGTTAYEKRCIAINVPEWDVDKCVECTECSLCCPHAAIRPVLLDADELKKASAGLTARPAHGQTMQGLSFRIQIYPADCVGCATCATICPGHALSMKPLASQLGTQKPLLEYCQKHVMPKDGGVPRATINGSQFHQPLLEFSGACAGCGETPYVKLLTQLFGERMIIANATGCSSIWGANFPSNAYCTLPDGRGPAWGNSLFEDNAEYGYGIVSAIDARRQLLAHRVTEYAATASPEVKAAAQTWLDAINDAEKSQTAGDALAALLRKEPQSALRDEILARTDLLGKKSVWAVGGDGWAYDIGFAGLDHVLAQNIDINMMVLDTECYSNTGGQTSKATPLGAVMKYAADGKRTYKKDLGRMMMTYGTVYVASIALGANYMQAIRAIAEAEAYPGPSIVICYCPCINHGIRKGMGYGIFEERDAVRAGYWQLYRYDPRLAAQGKDPLQLDSAAPDGQLVPYINGENRYADLRMIDPREAAILQPQLARRVDWLYSRLSR
ncbi:MAG: pyruvate:ferredoxin (flavodoxin) oxidoreductase [Muribaculaceae bacterium]